MILDATFWVAVSFIIFIAVLVYLKVPQKINSFLNIMIEDIKNELNEAEKLKKEAKNLLNESQEKLENAQEENELIIKNAQENSEKLIIEINNKFFQTSENRKKITEQKIEQMKEKLVTSTTHGATSSIFDDLDEFMKVKIVGNGRYKGIDKHIEMFLQGMKDKGIMVVPSMMYLYNDGPKRNTKQQQYFDKVIKGPSDFFGKPIKDIAKKRQWLVDTVDDLMGIKGFVGSYRPIKNKGPHFYTNYKMPFTELGVAPPGKNLGMKHPTYGLSRGDEIEAALNSWYIQEEKRLQKELRFLDLFWIVTNSNSDLLNTHLY